MALTAYFFIAVLPATLTGYYLQRAAFVPPAVRTDARAAALERASPFVIERPSVSRSVRRNAEGLPWVVVGGGLALLAVQGASRSGTRPSQRARSGAVSMEYRLNNYILPGPVQPVYNQCMVTMRKLDETTAGGLLVPTAESEKPKEGKVIGAGPGSINQKTGALMPNPVKEGDLVLLPDFTGETVEYNGQRTLFIDGDDLLGKFEGGQMTEAAFSPIGDRMMIAVSEAATETTTGIALAGLEEEDDNQGQVVAVGTGALLDTGEVADMPFAVGDWVMHKRRAGSEATIEGKRYRIVPATSVLVKW